MRVKTIGRSSQDKKNFKELKEIPKVGVWGKVDPKWAGEAGKGWTGEPELWVEEGLERDWEHGWRSGAGHHQDPDDGKEKEMNL